jgi:putative membrane protein
MMWNGYGLGGWGMAAMLASSVLFWTLLVGGAVLLYRALRDSPKPAGPSSAEQQLGERYARGEIDDQEYQHRLTVLKR